MRIITNAAGILVATTALFGIGAGVALADTPIAPAAHTAVGADTPSDQFKMYDNANHRLEITGYSDPSLFTSAPRVGSIINPGRGPATITMSGPSGYNLIGTITFTEIADNQAKTPLGEFTMTAWVISPAQSLGWTPVRGKQHDRAELERHRRHRNVCQWWMTSSRQQPSQRAESHRKGNVPLGAPRPSLFQQGRFKTVTRRAGPVTGQSVAPYSYPGDHIACRFHWITCWEPLG